MAPINPWFIDPFHGKLTKEHERQLFKRGMLKPEHWPEHVPLPEYPRQW